MDWDEIFSYDTLKVVRIRDAKLGFLHYFLMLCIIGYLIGYTIIWEKRYVISGTPIGNVRLSLLAPTVKKSNEDLPYCWPPKPPKPGQYNISTSMIFNCTYYDEKMALPAAPVMDSSIFIGTRLTTTLQHLNHSCTLSEPNCTFIDTEEKTIYIPDIDQFTIMFDHSMYVNSPRKQASGNLLLGTLYDSNGHVMSVSSPESFGQYGKFDILKLGTVLHAAGISSLDSPGVSRGNLTKRYEGLLVLFFIEYSNMFSFNLNDMRYTARASFIENSYFKLEEASYPYNGNVSAETAQRIITNRHGTKVVVVQSGTIGQFDFPTTLISFASGLGLVAIATVIVDTLATKVLPKKKVYRTFKVSEVTNLSSVTTGDGSQEKIITPNESEYKTFARTISPLVPPCD